MSEPKLEPPVQIQGLREGAPEQAPERTLRSVWKEGRWYVEQIEKMERVLGRDVYTLVRKTYMKITGSSDWREKKRDITTYIVLTEIYDSEEGFRINIEEITKEVYTKKIKELKRECGK